MKYKIDDILNNETPELDITEYFPRAKETGEMVIIRLQRLSAKYQYQITACMQGGAFKGEKEYLDARKTVLLNGIVLDDDFPIEKWDAATIDGLEENKGQFLDFLVAEITDFNRPLSEKKSENSGQS